MTGKQMDTITRRLTNVLERIDALRDEVKSILNGLGVDHPIKTVLTHFDERWRANYARGTDTRYEFNGGKDAKHVETMLKTVDVTTLKLRIDRYFSDRETFLVKNRHPFNLFVSRINAYSTVGTSTPASTLAEIICEHEPRCTNDAQHTRKRMHELRAGS